MRGLKAQLDRYYHLIPTTSFLDDDPIRVPHRYSNPRDIELAALFTATFAWGQRKTIIQKSTELLVRMDNQPYAFVSGASEVELNQLNGFVHRTFSERDALGYIRGLRSVFDAGLTLQAAFHAKPWNAFEAIVHFRRLMETGAGAHFPARHISDPAKNSAAKRLNMFLRWMVRKEDHGIDFGLWDYPASALMCPLDVHSGNTARQFGLLQRRQNDRQAVEELTANLRKLDPNDPVKYDLVLYGLGAGVFKS